MRTHEMSLDVDLTEVSDRAVEGAVDCLPAVEPQVGEIALTGLDLDAVVATVNDEMRISQLQEEIVESSDVIAMSSTISNHCE